MRVAGPLLSSAGQWRGGSLAKGDAVAGGRNGGARGSESGAASSQGQPVRRRWRRGLRRWLSSWGGAPGMPCAGGRRLGVPLAPVAASLQWGPNRPGTPCGGSRPRQRRPPLLLGQPGVRVPHRGEETPAVPHRGRHASGKGGAPGIRRSCRRKSLVPPCLREPPLEHRRAAARVPARVFPGAPGGGGGSGRRRARCWGRGRPPGGPPRQVAAGRLRRPQLRRQVAAGQLWRPPLRAAPLRGGPQHLCPRRRPPSRIGGVRWRTWRDRSAPRTPAPLPWRWRGPVRPTDWPGPRQGGGWLADLPRDTRPNAAAPPRRLPRGWPWRRGPRGGAHSGEDG